MMGGDRDDWHVGISDQGETEPRAKRPFVDKQVRGTNNSGGGRRSHPDEVDKNTPRVMAVCGWVCGPHLRRPKCPPRFPTWSETTQVCRTGASNYCYLHCPNLPLGRT